MSDLNIQLKTISLTVCGIRTFEKRKAIFNWLNKQKADLCFLQETYSTKEVENQWKKQWRGDAFFAHGDNHSRGVLILVRKDLDFISKSVRIDDEGRFVLLEALIQDTLFLLMNIYAPNKMSEQSIFYRDIQKLINETDDEKNHKIMLGRDFNITFDQKLDCLSGNPIRKSSLKAVEDIMLEHNLIDIWRVRNPECKRFTWRQKCPLIQRRLDYWLISNALQDDIENADIVTSIKTDHSAIALEINSLAEQERGPSFWKFNNSLLTDTKYVDLITDNIPIWLEEAQEVSDVIVKWDWLKYRIRYNTINYSKKIARKRRGRLHELEQRLEKDEERCATLPTKENLEALETTKIEYEKEFDYIVLGSIIRSRATWYEKGEKNHKYFLNIENSKKKKVQ